MDRVVVGLDGSPTATAATRWAAQVAGGSGWSVRAIWAWQYPAATILPIGRADLPNPEEVERRLGEQARELLHEALGDRADSVTLEFRRGPAAGALLHAVREGARMVVVGSRGLGGFEGMLLGSVSRQLVEHAPCPVTIVRHEPAVPDDGVAHVLVGIDGSRGAARALAFAGELARAIGAELTVASAVSPSDLVQADHEEPHTGLDEHRKRIWEWTEPLRESGIEHQVAVVDGDARTALLDLAGQRGADLLVVGSRGLGPVGKLLLGSVASSLVKHARLPVTVVPSGR